MPRRGHGERTVMDRDDAVALLRGLVEIRSVSGQEAEAADWLVERARAAGYDRALVDGAGNAVAELGSETASRVVVLLGHIDTVAGEVPVHVEQRDGRAVLYGRGTVDAKGPLAAFVAAGARLGAEWARAADLRLVVVGAVEEEAASSKGARFVAARFDGRREPVPAACVIGEPSRWDRVTIGYKGRLLVDLEARRAMTHSAGPEATAATAAVGLWSRVESWCAAFNQGREKAFEQLLPSLRSIQTSTDGLEERATAGIGLRLPPDFDPAPLQAAIQEWASGWVGVGGATRFLNVRSKVSDESGRRAEEVACAARVPQASRRFPAPVPAPGAETESLLAGPAGAIRLVYRAHEPAWRGDARNALVRSFLAAIRAQADPAARPAFVVKTGTSDLNVVGPTWRCPILAYGPGDSRLDHTPDEHLALDEYWRAVLVLERALDSLSESLGLVRS
ncbi:MAG TPA: M20/M25/M40 family metallo-hydrolase [Thermoanaerobaculia bacterium]|nr:M20/M25/M40 family metallo-hydrolase [Thermoanaerobaculia bacterium]